MKTLLPLALLLVACKPPIDLGDDSSSPGDSGTPPAEPVTYDWVLTDLAVSSGQDGFDLDGDADADNALAPLDIVVDPLLDAALTGSERVLVTQLADVDGLEEDTAVRAALFGGTDGDGDHSAADNFSGQEPFDAGAAVDGEGNATDFAEVALTGGRYEAVFPARSIQVGSAELEATTEVHLAGRTLSEGAQSGAIGFGISLASLVAVAEAQGVDPDDLDRLAAIADLDTDHDGTHETISASFDFSAVHCTLE